MNIMKKRGSYSFDNPAMEQELVTVEKGTDSVSTEDETFPVADPFEQLDDKTKELFQNCQKHDLNAILKTIGEENVEKVDKNKMNVFHQLLYDAQNQDWFTKNLDSEASKNVVKIIKAICQKFPKVTDALMIMRDGMGRTPLHYAGIIDVEAEEEENITLAFLNHGADKALFIKDDNEDAPVDFIRTGNLKTHLDTKQRIEGPIGHERQMAHCDTSILRPEPSKTDDKSGSLGFDYLEILAKRHRDLFDHQVISAMIW